MKHKILFDVTDADTIAASDSIGAYVRASDGTLITATGTALDVSVSNASIAVTATDLDIRDLAFATDKVDVSGSEVSLDSATLAALENITVSATDLDIRDLSHTQDSVKVGDGTDFLAVNADGSINITDNGGSLTVDATNLDIRDLTAASDSVQANLFDGAGNAISSTAGALNVNVASGSITVVESDVYAEDSAHTSGDEGGFVLAVRQDTLASSTSADGDYAAFKVNQKGELYVKDSDVLAQLISGVTVTATDFDIRDLSHTQDSVKIGDGTDFLAVNADGSINVVTGDAELANTAVLAASSSVTTTSAAVLASQLSDRKYLTVYNNGSKMVYVGQSGVSTSNGFPLPPGSLLEMRLGPAVSLHAVAQAGTQDVRSLQLS